MKIQKRSEYELLSLQAHFLFIQDPFFYVLNSSEDAYEGMLGERLQGDVAGLWLPK